VVRPPEALLVEARDLEPERETLGLVGLGGDEREERAARLVEASGLLVDPEERAEPVLILGVEHERAPDQRERAIAIAEARVVDVGGAEEQAPLEPPILGEIGLGDERARELLVIAGALRVAREREDRGAPPRLDGEDAIDLLDGARGLAELVLPD